jgi:putative ABC transport system permease protein
MKLQNLLIVNHWKKTFVLRQRFTVIGVFEKAGEGIFGDSNDTTFIPVNFF